MVDQDTFLNKLLEAIDDGRLTLPTLPEVAIKVRSEVESDNSTATSVANIVATDAALSARLLQVANSPLYRGRVPIENLSMAVSRLGTRLVRSLVVSLIMQQIFQATSDFLDRRFRQVWEESVQLASICRVLASKAKHLDPEQALLAGLIHNIGALPILTMAERMSIEDPDELEQLINSLNPIIGEKILEEWDFSEALIKVPRNYQDITYDGGPQADYVDLVIVGRQELQLDPEHINEHPDWHKMPAFEKLGIEPDVQLIDIEGVADDMAELGSLLEGRSLSEA